MASRLEIQMPDIPLAHSKGRMSGAYMADDPSPTARASVVGCQRKGRVSERRRRAQSNDHLRERYPAIMPIAPDIDVDQDALAAICDQYGIAELKVFGSRAHGTARPDS